jgi:hypothetical protein
MDLLAKHHAELQERPDQYVIAIYKKGPTEESKGTLIGYHASTVGQVVDDILEAKRYAGLNAYEEQIPVCAKNISFVANFTEELKEKHQLLGELFMMIKKERYEGIQGSDLYLEAVYLNENTPKQKMRYTIL